MRLADAVRIPLVQPAQRLTGMNWCSCLLDRSGAGGPILVIGEQGLTGDCPVAEVSAGCFEIASGDVRGG